MRLIVLRHAKSDWNTGATTDHARPLNPRGRFDAPRVGEALRTRGWIPDVLLSSDSRRTQETWAHMGPVLAPALQGQFLPSLYHAGMQTIAPLLAQQHTNTVLVLGHNPGMEEVVATLTGQAEAMATCNAALLHCTAQSWAEALLGVWDLIDILRPRELT